MLIKVNEIVPPFFKFSLLLFFAPLASAHENANTINTSGRTPIFENPFIVIGINPKNHAATGYVSALRIAPGRTDECKFAFQGKSIDGEKTDLMIADVTLPFSRSRPTVTGSLKQNGSNIAITVNRVDSFGNCGWILGFVGEPAVIEREKQSEIRAALEETGSWTSINIVRAKRAYFHRQPDDSTKEKSFVVAGDVLYAYAEIQDWYYVKYESDRKEIVGWIRKADTVQFPER